MNGLIFVSMLAVTASIADAKEFSELALEQAAPVAVKATPQEMQLPKAKDLVAPSAFGFVEDRAFRDFFEHRCYRKSTADANGIIAGC